MDSWKWDRTQRKLPQRASHPAGPPGLGATAQQPYRRPRYNPPSIWMEAPVM
jgi:hypothetical protein